MTSTTRPAPKFKVGDKVRINANGPRLYWVNTMDNFKTKDVVGVINQEQDYDQTVGSYTYHLDECEGYGISEQDFELVEESNATTRLHAKARPHADLIIAWANGAEIEYSFDSKFWQDVEVPSWDCSVLYRIKPEEPAVVPVEFFMQMNATKHNHYDFDLTHHQLKQTKYHNVKATVDKNTGKLLSIEMLNKE